VTPLSATVSPDWLALREPADHAARACDLVAGIVPRLGPGDVVVHDLGSGTGSMSRWLAPQLPGRQRWVLHDRDSVLLARAGAAPPLYATDGSPVHVDTCRDDVTTLTGADLSGCSLVTASALLDLLTAAEMAGLAAACVEARSPVLLSLTVTGRVTLTPWHAMDDVIVAAFNDHQRRSVSSRRLLGPDAVGHAGKCFVRLGVQVVVRDSPWSLGAADAELLIEWLIGWVGAACDQRPELASQARHYLGLRLADAAAGRLRVTVGHADLLALPAGIASNHPPQAHVVRPGRE
jgi:hypothetical protein